MSGQLLATLVALPVGLVVQRTYRSEHLRSRAWSIYFWTLYALAVVALLAWTPAKWRFGEGLVFGMLGMAYFMLPDALMPEPAPTIRAVR